MGYVQYVGKLHENTNRVNQHMHSSWELVIYTSGTGFVDVGEEHFSFAPHDIFLLPPHVSHTDYSENGFKNYHCNYVEKDFPYNAVKKLRDDENGSLLRVMELMYYEFNLKRKNYKNIIASLYTLLLQYIDAFSEKKMNQYVEFIINEILNNISNKDYNVSETVSRIPLTEDYIRKLFLRETGKTPLQYLTYKRIDTAKQLLRIPDHGGLQIKEIAAQVGFYDSYYFSKVFKRTVGCSPIYWRENAKLLDEQDIRWNCQ